MTIRVQEYKPKRRAQKIAALVAKGETPKRAEKQVPKRYEVVITYRHAKTGAHEQDKRLTSATTPSGARDWADARLAELNRQAYEPAAPAPKKRIPTLAEWWPKYMLACVAEGHTSSSITGKQSCFDAWLSKHLGELPLDQIDDSKRSALQLALATAGINPVNKLQALSSALHKAVKHKVITAMPCSFAEEAKLAGAAAKRAAPFYLYDQYDALLRAAASDLDTYAIVLLGGDAGLRAGEICGLEWPSISFERMEIAVEKSIWYGIPAAKRLAWIAAGKVKADKPPKEYIIQPPKHGKVRRVPMTKRLATALRKLKLRSTSSRVFTQDDGQWLHTVVLEGMLRDAERSAQLGRDREGCCHVLRHTFCSYLALAGVPARVIQELAGHHSINVTQRYMHLAPNSASSAVAVLDAPRPETRAETSHEASVTS